MRLRSLADRGRHTVIGGALSGLGGQSLVWLLGVPTSILIARAVGPEGRGEYYLPVTAAAVAAIILHLSLENANSVTFAERRFTLAELSRSMSLATLILGPLAVAAMVGVYLLTKDSVFEGVSLGQYLIAAATVPFFLHLTWLTGLFTLARQIPRTQIALVVGALAYLAGAALLYAMDELGVTEVLLLYASSVVLPWSVLALWSRDVAPLRPARSTRVLRELASLGSQLHLGQVFVFLLIRFDIFLVSIYLGTTEVGIYSLAVLISDLAVVVTWPLVMASLPFQAEVTVRESVGLAFKTARFNFAVAAALALLFAATMWFLIPFVYGEGFSDAYPALLIRLVGICAYAAGRPLLLLLQRQRRPLLYSGLSIAAFAIDVALNLILLPSIGMLGASIAASVALTALAVALLVWGLRVAGQPARQLLAPQPDDRETLRRAYERLRGLRGDIR